MKDRIRLGIVGYGNLGRAAEKSLELCRDMELVAVFSRRHSGEIQTTAEVAPPGEMLGYKNKIDVMLLCGSSVHDLPSQGPMFARHFNTVDSYDLHGQIPQHFSTMDEAAREGANLSVISIGWDPGLFSLARLLFCTVLPGGKTYTFWGKGVSQGHSNALRRIPGVKDAIQYTVPVEETLEQIRQGTTPELTPRQQHRRICFVVPEEGTDLPAIESTIKEMPGYFADYDTTVNFITQEEFTREHKGMPHGGSVIRTGQTGGANDQQMEFRLALGDNPQFTASVLVAYARAAYRMQKAGERGARTIFDIPLGLLSPVPPAQLHKELL